MDDTEHEGARDRAALIAGARAWMAEEPAVRAAWLGGSDASGRVDTWSDVDLLVAAADDRIEAVLAGLVEALGPYERATRFAQPTFHGHEQIILRPCGAADHCLVDLVVMSAGTPPERRLLEPERHGRPVVLLDRDGFLAELPRLDADAVAATIAARVPELRDRFHLFHTLVVRAVERGHLAEAADRYQRMVLLPLVELARIVHCPDRHAFGARYLDRDVPAVLRTEIERLAMWGDPAMLRRHLEDVVTLFTSLEVAWDRGDARAVGESPPIAGPAAAARG